MTATGGFKLTRYPLVKVFDTGEQPRG